MLPIPKYFMINIFCGRPAFFSCLGVLMYLTEKAVDSILQFVAMRDASPATLKIVYDLLLFRSFSAVKAPEEKA